MTFALLVIGGAAVLTTVIAADHLADKYSFPAIRTIVRYFIPIASIVALTYVLFHAVGALL